MIFWQQFLNLGLLFFISEWAIRLIMLGVVPWRRGAQAASAWLLLIFFLPWPGLILYLIIGWPKLPAWRREKLEKWLLIIHPDLSRLGHSAAGDPSGVCAEFAQTIRLATNLGRLPIATGNQIELDSDYQSAINRLVTDIDSAVTHVHLQYYIFADDSTTAPVIDALGRAVLRGVTCKVLVDSVGNKRWNRSLLAKLNRIGVNAREILPVGLFRHGRRTRYDLRNHRKIAVVDGRIGYIGSQNLVDPWFKPELEYEEVVARVTGPVVLHLQMIFSADWFSESDEVLSGSSIFPEPVKTGTATAQVLASGPSFQIENNQRLIVSLIHEARSRIVFTTPYFIPDEALLQALQTAVLRGVDVHLIVSRQKDQMLVGLAQESYYGQLLDAGVRIHRYQPRFLHAKHLTFDDQIAIIGSSNIDIRSFLLNSEASLIAYDRDTVTRLRLEQERYFANSEAMSSPQWHVRPKWKRMVQNIARLISPLL